MTKRLKKIINLLFFFAIFSLISFGSYALSPLVDGTNLYGSSVYGRYKQAFKNSIKNKMDYKEHPNNCYVKFDRDNDMLIIGCSPVVFLAKHAREESVKGYDIIGFGGTADEDIIDWMRLIDKKYKKIVVWGFANNVFELMDVRLNYSFKDYGKTFVQLVNMCKSMLESDSSDIVFVEIKTINPNYDLCNQEFADRYNAIGACINAAIENEKSVKHITINEYPTDRLHTEWFIHFTSPEILDDILRKIKEA